MDDKAWMWYLTNEDKFNVAHGNTDTLSEALEQMDKAKKEIRARLGSGTVLHEHIGKYSLNG